MLEGPREAKKNGPARIGETIEQPEHSRRMSSGRKKARSDQSPPGIARQLNYCQELFGGVRQQLSFVRRHSHQMTLTALLAEPTNTQGR